MILKINIYFKKVWTVYNKNSNNHHFTYYRVRYRKVVSSGWVFDDYDIMKNVKINLYPLLIEKFKQIWKFLKLLLELFQKIIKIFKNELFETKWITRFSLIFSLQY